MTTKEATSSFIPVSIGIVGGIASGLLGIGGGVLMVPLLVMASKLSQRQAHAASLAAIAPIAVVSTVVYLARDQVWWEAAAWIALGAVLGAPIGVGVLRKAPEYALRGVFTAVALIAGLRLVFG